MDNDKLTDEQIEQISNKVIYKLCSDFIEKFKFALVVAVIFLCMLIGLGALLKSINQELFENFLEILKYT